ncbi:MAG: PhoPQ-activated protein PqaA family protein [Bacteroidota bacterium]
MYIKFFTSISLLLVLLFFSFQAEKSEPITAKTALQSYLENGDESFTWEVKESFNAEGITAHELLLTSQQWREHTWTHQLTVLVPQEIKYDGALLFITGGSVKDGEPRWKSQDEEVLKSFGAVAAQNSAIVAVIRQVPNQPLYNNLKEDELISFTLDNFRKDNDYTWPLLFPMTKSAIRAMDAIQEFSKSEVNQEVSRFVISGASKRGWTTWLTGASDERVAAIAPMVIDMLNMPVNLDYQVEVWGDYSVQIQDYVELGIPQDVHSEGGNEITQMIDPYSYRDKLTMPKMLFIGANDEYWPIDAVKNYFDDIPGENFIHYVPNAGHDLGGGEQALKALSAFFGTTLRKEKYPVCEWDIAEKNGEITLKVKATPDPLVDVVLWSADSEDRDFRDEEWVSQSLGVKNQKNIKANIAYPTSGFKAFYVDLKYTDANGSVYSKSTQSYVADEDEVFINSTVN